MTKIKTDKIIGSILGLALGDAFGAPYEGGILERVLWMFLGTKDGKRRWTDDTQMSIDVIESLLEYRAINQDDLASRFAASYQYSRGYGPAAAKILKRIRHGQSWQRANVSVYQDGSFGNGGAMRVAAVGLFFAKESEEEIIKHAHETAIITHSHPLGLEGAGMIALAAALSFNEQSSQQIIEHLLHHASSPAFTDRLNQTKKWIEEPHAVSAKMAAKELGNKISASESCVTAIYTALAFRESSFDEMLAFIIEMGGDVDTIGAMAGAIWGAARGFSALPEEKLQALEAGESLQSLAETFAKVV